MNTSPPEHDELCEAGAAAGLAPCRCADRRDATGIDPTLLKMRVKRVRQATEALEKVKHTLATYVSGHAPTHCEHVLNNENATLHRRCSAAVDGFILLSCGHHAFLCAEHGSQTLRAVQEAHETFCSSHKPSLHAGTVYGVTIEWVSLA